MTFFTANDTNVFVSDFIMFPKELLKDKYSHISLEAKFLYALLLNRTALSIKNHLMDKNGNIYIIYKQSDVQNELGFSKQKVQKMFSELENNSLIFRQKQHCNLPDMIFVTKLSEDKQDNYQGLNSELPKNENKSSEGMKIIPLSNTDKNKTNKNREESIYHQKKQNNSELIDITSVRNSVYSQIEYDAIKENLMTVDSKNILDNIVSIITEVYSKKNGKTYVNGESVYYTQLKPLFAELNQFHVEYVLECISSRTSTMQPIKNLKAYLMTALFNAPKTMDEYYKNQIMFMQSKFKLELNKDKKVYFDSLVI